MQRRELLWCHTQPAPPVTRSAAPLPAPPPAALCPALSGGSFQRALVGDLSSFGVQSKHSHYSIIATKFPKGLICLILLCKSYLSVSTNCFSNRPTAEIAAVSCAAFFFSCSVCLWANPGCPMSVMETLINALWLLNTICFPTLCQNRKIKKYIPVPSLHPSLDVPEQQSLLLLNVDLLCTDYDTVKRKILSL